MTSLTSYPPAHIRNRIGFACCSFKNFGYEHNLGYYCRMGESVSRNYDWRMRIALDGYRG